MNRMMTTMALAAAMATASAGAQVIEWDVIGSGGGEMAGGGSIVNGTVSQTADILVTAGANEIGQGFWYRAGSRPQLATGVGGLQWYVIAGGGTQGAQNALYKLNGTVSQTADIIASAPGIQAGEGFWFGEPDLPLYKIREEESDGTIDGRDGGPAIAGDKSGARAAMTIAPNPIGGMARIILRLPREGMVRIAIYDVAGNMLGSAYEGTLEAGEQEVAFDGSRFPAGAYLVRMESEGEMVTRKITIIR